MTTTSSSLGLARRAGLPLFVLLVTLAAGLLVSFAAAGDDSKPSRIDAALAIAFPGCEVERVTCTLDEKQREAVAKLASQKEFTKASTFAYVARKDGKVVGTAFFDSHVVRTKRESLLIAVDPAGRVLRVDTIVFQEPPEYVAQEAFYTSLEGRAQGRELQLGRGLDGTTGATLTCRAVADAARRVLAVHSVLGEKVGAQPQPKPKPKPEPKPKPKPQRGETAKTAFAG